MKAKVRSDRKKSGIQKQKKQCYRNKNGYIVCR